MIKTPKIFSRYNSLVIDLALKDLRIKYRTPFLGFLWAFLIPFSQALILYLVFSFILVVPNQKFPFFIYLVTGVFPWRFFQIGITRMMLSIVENKSLVKDVSFPRYFLPLSVILAELVNYISSLVVILILIFCFRIYFSTFILFLPLVVLLHFLFIVGIGLLLSVFHVKYRDTQNLIEIILNILFYLTPVFYYLDSVVVFLKGPLSAIYFFNPFVSFLNLYRIVFLKGFILNLPSEVTFFNLVILPVLATIIFLFVGFWYFRKNEKRLVDFLTI